MQQHGQLRQATYHWSAVQLLLLMHNFEIERLYKRSKVELGGTPIYYARGCATPRGVWQIRPTCTVYTALQWVDHRCIYVVYTIKTASLLAGIKKTCALMAAAISGATARYKVVFLTRELLSPTPKAL